MSTSFQVKVWYMFNSKPTITTTTMHCINKCHGNFKKPRKHNDYIHCYIYKYTEQQTVSMVN